jgi:hypothetical protein
VADRELLSELRAIAEQSARAADAAGPDVCLLATYEALRERAEELARAHGWATSEELATSFPRLQALHEIERLDRAFELETSRGVPPDRHMYARLIDLLMELSGWATGVGLAFETLEEEPRSRD